MILFDAVMKRWSYWRNFFLHNIVADMSLKAVISDIISNTLYTPFYLKIFKLKASAPSFLILASATG